MARITSTQIVREARPSTVGSLLVSAEARQRMIREAAYFRYAQRGFEHGHDLDDWLAAEADVERSTRRRPPPEREMPRPAVRLAQDAAGEPGMQHGGPQGPAGDDARKRVIRGRSEREIPRAESLTPDEAPPRQ